QGPAVTIDGQAVPTKVHAPMTDLLDLKAVPFEACASPTLSTGEHRVLTAVDGALAVNRLELLPPAMASQPTNAVRTTTASHWGATSRDITLGPGAPAVLTTTENFNAGWQASFGGQRLQAVRVDGWRQGWLVPAGSGGTVHLSYGPDTTYFAGLMIGAAGLLLLVFIALAGRRRDDDLLPPTRPISTGAWWTPAVVVVTGFVVAGPSGVIVAALALWACPEHWCWRISVAAFALAGVFVTFDPGRVFGSGHGAFSRPVQFLSAAAFLLVVATLVDRPRKAHA
ncbi:MAG: hypothetical protein JO087_06895, partial [Actinobacteria bacterium]|nr:hypothetical protein [Actinomycetota bacterium]